MEDRERYGVLLAPDMRIHRQYFREMVALIGIHVLYRAPYPGKHWTTYTEIDSNYEAPLLIGCIFHDHPNQYTLKKLGWVSELQENASLIEVDYDLPNLQRGALFIVPSGLDQTEGRLFRVTRLSNDMVYPSSMVCEIVPEYVDTFEPQTSYDFDNKDFTLLDNEKERMFVDDEQLINRGYDQQEVEIERI